MRCASKYEMLAPAVTFPVLNRNFHRCLTTADPLPGNPFLVDVQPHASVHGLRGGIRQDWLALGRERALPDGPSARGLNRQTVLGGEPFLSGGPSGQRVASHFVLFDDLSVREAL